MVKSFPYVACDWFTFHLLFLILDRASSRYVPSVKLFIFISCFNLIFNSFSNVVLSLTSSPVSLS